MKKIYEMLPQKRRLNLESFCDLLIRGERNRKNWESYKDDLDEVNAEEVVYLVDYIMDKVPSIDNVKIIVSRLIHSVSYTLDSVTDSEASAFLVLMLKQNSEIEKDLASTKSILKQEQMILKEADQLISRLDILLELLKTHYELMENLVFPILEKEIAEHSCTALMWSIHIDAYKAISTGKEILAHTPIDLKEFHRNMGILSFATGTIVFRENNILFPAMQKLLPNLVWDQLSHYMTAETLISSDNSTETSIDLGTGSLNKEQLLHIFSNLPVDITLVDKDDTVVFYNTPEKRFFPRTPAVIGRKVHQCHPPKSIAIVERIIQGFKEKLHSKAEFTIHIKDQYLLITYFALYDEHGEYDGVLEVLQEISGIQRLSGDKRLLDWCD